jgi:hypothetical protein
MKNYLRKRMKFNAIKSLIGAVAPTIGTALGGPMGGMAANMIAEVLGVPNTPKAINTALGSTPHLNRCYSLNKLNKLLKYR